MYLSGTGKYIPESPFVESSLPYINKKEALSSSFCMIRAPKCPKVSRVVWFFSTSTLNLPLVIQPPPRFLKNIKIVHHEEDFILTLYSTTRKGHSHMSHATLDFLWKIVAEQLYLQIRENLIIGNTE